MEVRARLARNLRRIRVARELSQESLAVDANVDRGYISGIETQGFNPSVDVLARLASALSVDIVELFKDYPEGSPEPDPLKSGRRPNLPGRLG